MIFKTFDSDIDKWTTKIGIFGKSFNELGTAVKDAFKTTIDNIDNFDEDISFWDALKNNLIPKNENGESWLKNSLGEIISKENIDSYIAELDLDSAKDKLSEIFDFNTDVKNGNKTWQDYFDTLQDGSEHYIPDVIKNTDDLSKLTGEDLVNANQAARDAAIAHNAALKQQTLSAKAGQVALKGLATVGNMIAFMAIVKGIELIGKAIDEAITTTEEYREQLSNLKSEVSDIESKLSSADSEFKTISQRIKELESKGALTFTEKEEYDNLVKQNNELKRSIDLLKLEQQTKNKEKNKTFVDTMKSDVRSNNEYTSSGDGEIFKGNNVLYSLSGTVYSLETEEAYINQQFDKRRKLLDDKAKAETKEQEDRIQSQIDEIDKYLQSKSEEWRIDSEGIDYIQNPTTEDDKAVNEWLDYIADFQDKMAIELGDDSAKINAFNRIVDSTQFDDTVQGLQDLGEQGKVTADMLDDSKYDDFINKLVEIGVIDSKDNLQGIADAFNDVANSAEEAKGEIEKTTNEIGGKTRRKMISTINEMSDGFDVLDEIYADIKDGGTFDFTKLDTKKFEEAFKGLETEYEDFIETVSKSPSDINACQDAFDNLVTAFINNKIAIGDLTEENREVTEAMLTNMGVQNAKAVVTDMLTAKTQSATLELEKYKNAELDQILATDSAGNSLYSKVSALLDDANMTDTARGALVELVAETTIFNNKSLSVGQKIQALGELAIAAGIAADSIDFVNKIGIGTPAGMGYDPRFFRKDYVETTVKSNYQNLIKAKFGNYSYTPTASYGGADKSNKTDSSSGGSDNNSPEQFDWVEKVIKVIQQRIESLGKVVSSTYKIWSKRNNALVEEIGAVSQEISVQQRAYDTYMSKANSVGLSGYYRNLVQSGDYSIEEISDDTLKEQIKTYEEWYDKAIECKKAAEDLYGTLAELAKTKFDNVSKEFEERINLIKSQADLINTAMDINEAKGYVSSAKYYEKLTNIEQDNISQLVAERNALTNALQEAINSGNIEVYSSDWYEMTNSILEVDKAIQDANKSIVEFQDSIRQLKWEMFDKNQEFIGEIQKESDFIIELMSNGKLFDDNGNWTNLADATGGLYAVNYNAYMAQADQYAKEIQSINKDLANDPYNTKLLERRQELIDLQRESIQSAESEKQKIKSLISDGYDKMLSYLQEIINKRKELLQSTKSLYDYEKNISEQTKNISSLEKQLGAYSGDNSEETQSKIQQIKVQLEEARQNLQDTEYDKWLQDQEQMLDTIVSETEEWINERLDNLDLLIREMVGSTNEKSDEIKKTIIDETAKVGYTLSDNIRNIFTTSEGNITNIVKEYGNNFSSALSTVNSTLSSIRLFVEKMYNASDAKANADIAKTNSSVTQIPSVSTAPPTPAPAPAPQPESSNNSAWGSWFIGKKFTGNKSIFNRTKEISIVDRLIVHVKHPKLRETPESLYNQTYEEMIMWRLVTESVR